MSAKRKSFTSVAKPVIRQSPKVALKSRIDESKTVVSSGLTSKAAAKRGQQVEDASDVSGASDNEVPDSEDEEETKTSNSKSAGREVRKQKADQDAVDTEMTSPDDAQDQDNASDDGEPTSPTFGDLVRGATTVDVSSSLAAQAPTAVTRSGTQSRSVAPVTSTSLGTVLNQALKTDDRDLLESCLQVNDVNIIQNTISRMDSSLAGVLLSKLADRMHRRPGRAFGLMKWMQWALIAHGGALVGQPGVVTQLSKLSAVLEERSRGLNSLLALKGKLDMLDAQMQFRKAIKNAKSEGLGDDDDDDESEDVDEPGVVYVEGQEDQPKLANGAGAARGDDEDDFPVANGFGDDSEDDSDEEDLDDLADDLAEIESMDEDDADLDDIEDESGEEDEDEDDDDVAAPPAKVQKTSSKFGKRK
ncbi:Dip2/Utp12 family-domain-containing protein [Cercophora newfieldiana]|uniref:Dip2/Utp12 family-domain-containing protein n=1 Tax=Cercophora newfieldiana TaxID=92897 RepID=A0AA40CML0_9PEZI|nr:Dip2/Utp12 family-domain-containing protein [Cercophora newfieldiana]